MTCVFCEIASGAAPATFIREWRDAFAIVPLDPVAPGHVLVIPREHVADIAEDQFVSGATMQRAAELADEVGDCNVITSRGRAATQTVFHLHLHVVPRTAGDGLTLPWTGQARTS
ncbi:HIT domain-containing protein [Embleya sp. NPDC005971]|uniref:HIT family protein n=1 Tax=Embleya sp. NPDC005971 TaxID=3156724 RepID=UPI0034116327